MLLRASQTDFYDPRGRQVRRASSVRELVGYNSFASFVRRVVISSGTVSTIAGRDIHDGVLYSAFYTWADGTGSLATFYSPLGIAFTGDATAAIIVRVLCVTCNACLCHVILHI
jgi:hypothetical protein